MLQQVKSCLPPKCTAISGAASRFAQLLTAQRARSPTTAYLICDPTLGDFGKPSSRPSTSSGRADFSCVSIFFTAHPEPVGGCAIFRHLEEMWRMAGKRPLFLIRQTSLAT